MTGESLDYALYRAADLLSRTLPRRLAYGIAVRIAEACWRRDEIGRTSVEANLHRILAFRGQAASAEEVANLARRTFRNFGKYLVDFFRFARPDAAPLRLLGIRNPEHFRQAVDAGRGVVFVSAHLGNWDMGSAYVSSLGHTLHTVALAQNHSKTNRLFKACRQARGLRVIPFGHAAHDVVEAMRAKQMVALLADREYGTGRNATVFFGRPAVLPDGPARLAVRMQAPILPGFVLRQPDDTFALEWHAPIVPGPETRAEDVQERICRSLEQAIGSAPSQWYLFRRLWPDASDGAAV